MSLRLWAVGVATCVLTVVAPVRVLPGIEPVDQIQVAVELLRQLYYLWIGHGSTGVEQYHNRILESINLAYYLAR